MPEIVASRALRRRIPDRIRWEAVFCHAVEHRSAPRSELWTGIATAGLVLAMLGGGLWWTFQTEYVAVGEEAPVWMDIPQSVEEPVSPPVAPRSETFQSPDPPVAPPPLSPRPHLAPDPEPAFGLDETVETGGLAVATGSSLSMDPDPVVRAAEPPAGPVEVGSVPASARPVVPVYPPRAEAAGLESRVVAVVTTDTSGNVVEFRVERSGGREFDHAVRQAVFSSRFQVPRRVDGRAQAVAFRLPYDFRLQ